MPLSVGKAWLTSSESLRATLLTREASAGPPTDAVLTEEGVLAPFGAGEAEREAWLRKDLKLREAVNCRSAAGAAGAALAV